MAARWPVLLWALAVLSASVVFPRLMVLGGLPATDEGIYAYQAQLIHQGFVVHGRLPDTGPLALYPMLLAWVYALPFNPIVALRLVDLGVATGAAWLLYRVLVHASGSCAAAGLVTLLFVFTINQPLFIQSGFKNSIAAAFVPLLLAMRIAQRARADMPTAWWTAGALTALAVMLRETFVPFAVLGAASVLLAHGRGAALRFALGGVVGGAALLGTVVLARGGWSEMVTAYRETGTLYASLSDQTRALFLDSGIRAARAAVVALCLGAGAAIVLAGISLRRGDRTLAAGTAFWALAAALPLIEPATKIGFPYHFAVSLVGLAGLCALAWRALHSVSRPMAHMAGAVTAASAAGAVFVLWTQAPALLRAWPNTRPTLVAAAAGGWPAHAVARSNYLLAAEQIRKAVPPGGTVSVSGFMLALYPLSGHLPPSPTMANLSATLIQFGLSSERLRDALLRCAPNVVMTTTRTEWPGSAELFAAVQATGLYEQVAVIEVSRERDYGSFGGSIFRAKSRRRAPC